MTQSSAAAKSTLKKVLVVDDDPGILELLSTTLTPRDFDVTSCLTGQQAVSALQSQPFHLILLDLTLPDVHGLELIQRFRTISPSTRIVIITADTTSESLLRAIGEQAYEYIRKPFVISELLEVLQHAVSAADEPAIEVLSGKPDWVELSIPCTHSAVDRIERFVRQLAPEPDGDFTGQIIQALRELVLNAVEWGGGLDPNRRVRVCCIRTSRMLLYRVADPGPGFRFDNMDHSAAATDQDAFAINKVREAKGLRPGGLGIRLAQAIVDELLYNEKQNEVILIKYLDSAAPATSTE